MTDGARTIEELLTEGGGDHVYTRARYDADYARLLARLCAKHNVATAADVDALIARHDYVHTAEDPEEEWIQIAAFARVAGWLSTGENDDAGC